MTWRRAMRQSPGVLVCGVWVFHRGGRFLWASVGKDLEAYTFGPEGHLTRVDHLPSAAGRMAVTFPPPTVAGHP